MPRTDQTGSTAAARIKLQNHVGRGSESHSGADTPAIPTPTNRHIEFHDDRFVRAGVVLQVGGEEMVLSGLEFFNLLREAKSYARDWGSGDRPNRADIRDAIRQLKDGAR